MTDRKQRVCYSRLFYFVRLWRLGALWAWGGTSSPRVSEFLGGSKQLAQSKPLICKSTNPASLPSPTSLVLNHSEPGPRQLENTPRGQSPLKLLKLANPKPAHFSCPVPSFRNHNAGSWPCFHLCPAASWLTLVLPSPQVPRVAQHGPPWELCVTNHPFNGSCHLLIRWPPIPQ